MQLIDGVTLQQKLDNIGTLSLREVLRIGMQMAQALEAAHKQGLVHRDIKPANVLLENGVERVKITDFGLARAVDDASVTQSGTVAGTPMYMSPEQAEGLPIDHRSDLFSLGTVLYAMCAGHPPFRASGTHAVLKRVIDASPRPIRETNHEIPEWLCDIIAKLHAKKPEDRFQTAKEVAELLGQRLADVQAGRAIERAGSVSDRREAPASVAPTPVADAPGSPRRRLAFAAIGLLILVAIGLAITEVIEVTRFFRGPLQYEVTMRVDDLNITLRCSEARENETPEQFAERFREKASRNDFSDFMIANRFDGPRIMLPANTKWWILCERNGKLLYHKLVNVDRPQEVHLPWAAEWAKQKPLVEKTEPGWVQLFNGTDLKDWDIAPANGWKVENGLMVSNGINASISLRKPLFGDGICRMEYKLAANATANIGVRTKLKQPKSALWFGNGNRGEKTGSIIVWEPQSGSRVVAPSSVDVPQSDQWRIAEVIMRGNEMIVKIDGQETARHSFAELPVRGNVGLNSFGGVMHVRKIEVKEPPPESPPTPKAEWVSLFDGKDIKPWAAENPKAWRVEDNLLIGELPESAEQATFLRLDRELGDFSLKFEVRVDKLFAQINVRTEPARGPWKGYRWNFSGHLYSNVTKRYLIQQAKRDPLTEGNWHTVEMTAIGDRFIYKVDGKDVASGIDTELDKHLARGWLRIQIGPGTKIAFKKIEIKDLSIPPAPAAKANEHPKPRVVRFDPARDMPIDKDAIEKTADGWKIDFNKVAAYYVRRTFRLFELRDQELENCKVTLRGQIRTVARAGFTPIEASLRFDVYPQVESGLQRFSTRSAALAARGTTNWAPYEVSEAFHGRPIVFAVGINVEQRGEVWLKDLELVIEPLPEAQRRPIKDLAPPPTAAPTLVRRWTPDKDAFISLDGVSVDKTGWKIHHNLLYRDTLRLFELKDHKLGPGVLILKARMSSDVALGYGLKATPFLEFRPPLGSGKNQIKTAEPWTTTQRNENSAWYEARVHTAAAPELIAVNLRFEGHGSLWIEEIELLHLPGPD